MRDVAKWLEDQGLGEYVEAFAKNKIDGDVLPSLTGDDLKEMGVAAVGDRRRLLRAIASLSPPDIRRSNQGAAAPVISAEPSQEASPERRQLTVMFCDLVDSTRLSVEFDPEDVANAIRAYHVTCTKTVARWDGHIAKFMGDGVLAYFGWPRAHEDDPERAVEAGLELTLAVSMLDTAIGRPIAARVGIATGLVMVGESTGTGTARERAVVGETPNLAARLQGIAESGAVVVAASTRRLLGNLYETADLGEYLLKGFLKPVRASRILGKAPRETRFEALHGRLHTPLIGRDDEVELLTRRFRQAEAGEGQVVLISGEPGIGKSRLCEAVRAKLLDRPHARLTYQCSPSHADRAFYPLVMQLEQAADIHPELDPGEKLRRLAAILSKSAGRADDPLSVLAAFLSLPMNRGEGSPSLDAVQQKERTFDVLTGLIEDTCAKGPLVIIFEDLHWCDPSTREFLNRLVDRVEALPVLLIVTSRPGISVAWSDQPHVTTLVLNRIAKRECEKMIDALADSDLLPERVVEEIVKRSDGIPLFLEEMARTLIEAQSQPNAIGAFERRVPASLQDMLMARLDRLATGKRVYQTAAAIGREFTIELLERICDLDGDALQNALDALVDAGLLVSRQTASGTTYVFRHALLQDAAYTSLLRDARKELHKRIAGELTQTRADDPALLAHHYERANAWEGALDCRLLAAAKAESRAARWEAAEHYRRAIHALEHLQDTTVHQKTYVETVLACIRCGRPYATKEERAEALHQVDTAIVFADGDTSALAGLQSFKGVDWLEEPLLVSAERHASFADAARQAQVAMRYAILLGNTGRLEESLGKIEQATELLTKIGDLEELGSFAAGAGRCYNARAGRLERSLQFVQMVREIAQSTHDVEVRSWMVMEAEPWFYKGLWQRTVQVVEQNLSTAWENGRWSVVLWASGWAAIACLKLNRISDARALLDPVIKTVARRIDDDFCKIYPHIALSQLHLAEGDAAAGLQAAERALELAERVTARLEIGAARRALGQAYEAKGDRQSADGQFRRSVDILQTIQSRPELAQSLLAFGRFELATDRGNAKKLLHSALELFKEIQADGWITETQNELRHRSSSN
ncbi:MAG: guanylate cyclase [Mesorhizobium sp.]|uniref:AAA family ATPase n=1 Tax=Mesorhizobium sp. TaxID=1871066 RepID=UPI000FEA7B35|nr:AAA family ATPase [Mesorhizobium sp.]RWA59272.1 MAG: guanylate cyclase [Mesorhizobium sp.]RWB93315.1 MAG: guanylate cyclase [Mesorhizobium sp.]RWK01156.1 MAG: guanylate cyclase [Mesorhizobium sp.]TIQ39128.1 MAG: guanylate cyclase [Mesorhizobium sp.]